MVAIAYNLLRMANIERQLSPAELLNAEPGARNKGTSGKITRQNALACPAKAVYFRSL